MSAVSTAKVTVSPEEFTFVDFDAAEIADVVAELAEVLHIANPIRVVVDETTQMAKLVAAVDGASSDATIHLEAQSGALENKQHLTHFSRDAARLATGRMLLRARDRMRSDFADVADDRDLSLAENAAWDAYCVGRLARLGVTVNQQRWRYDYRNRFGFSDATDAAFDRLWAADDLGWAEIGAAAPGTS